MRVYSNFEQIDRDLRILKLKQEINKEELRLNVNGARDSVTSGLSPISIVGSMAGSLIQKALVAKLVGTIFGYKKVKK